MYAQGDNDNIRQRAADLTSTAQAQAASLAEVAKPGPIPPAAGGSPIDGAAAVIAGAVASKVAASMAEISPRGPKGLATTESAVQQMGATDADEAAKIKAVPEPLQAQQAALAAGGGGGVPRADRPLGPADASGIQAASFSPAPPPEGPWGLDDDEWELNEWGSPQPIWPVQDPGGAGPGPSVGGGLAPI
ncbi:hypothetical protein PDG61_21025 [Mycolicibacterium sp. BiH015]|uniref:hypothetical protein n=1 Tax=Mycolicibacterium sp. BiH015 TaxID=3018808 RepID=UPI0022E5B6C4|nr:hypothetical protein [Mycolicibacterium sp. BiH015]MDA2893411.1 hypothetical protein [Mycolicibacterium sp. BiH015]